MNFSGRRILLGVTGGIAAYKSAELVRLLSKAGAEVQVVMTSAAQQFITPLTLQTLSGKPVRSALFDPQAEYSMGHIELARWADIILIAPATADFIARLAHGRADDLLSAVCLASDVEQVVAPAMNRRMWDNPATRTNIATLQQHGIAVWGPADGDMACGESGSGRLLEPAELMQRLSARFQQGRFAGIRVLLTAGPTHEPLDPVRFIGNRSSGRMGFALASAFSTAGAEVELISGPVSLETPAGVSRSDVQTAAEMAQRVAERVQACDLFVACAAVADYRVADIATQKIKKSEDRLSLQLLRNPDILASVAALTDGPFTVGFAAETENLLENAAAKRVAKGIDVIAANQVGGTSGGFDARDNALTLIWQQGQVTLPLQDKMRLATQMVEYLADIYSQTKTREQFV